MNNFKEIDSTRAFELIRNGALLVDVREPDEVAEASFDVEGVMLVPFSTVEARFSEIPVDRDVIIGCKVGERSQMVTFFLMNHGYEKAVNMQDGIVGWVENGLPIKGELKSKTCGCCCGGSAGHSEKSGGSCC
ncbi:MAG: rhodanese-like domain-containing protein [Chlorobiaceae bacterium]|nr:rhodanese-like domain-containing protein [Chlorobiaceae bacterium]